MSAFVPVSPSPDDSKSNKKRKLDGGRGGAQTQPYRMFGSRIEHINPRTHSKTPPPRFSMPPPAGRRPRSPTFSEGDGTETARVMVNLLTLKQNKDKAAMEFIRYKKLEDEFNEWYKNKP